MKIVIIGGTGLIGSKLASLLEAKGHDVVVASPSRGINSVTGEGLDKALVGAGVVVDVSNSPSFEAAAVLAFFETSTRNLLAAEKRAGVGHHVALSVVGIDRMADNGYMAAKIAQETLINTSGIPYSILRATQFFEFLDSIAAFSEVDGVVRVPGAAFQPVAAEDVAAVLAELVVAAPTLGCTDLAGPDRQPMDQLIRDYLVAKGDVRRVICDDSAGYFGTRVEQGALVPEGESRIGTIGLRPWMESSAVQA